MAVLKKEEFISALKTRIGEDTSEEAIKFLEDMADTYADLEGRIGEDWKTKYEQNDAEWRTKYRDRFFSGAPENHSVNEPEHNTKPEPEPEPEPDPQATAEAETFEGLFE